MLEAAAADEHTTLSEFMRRMAVRAAETALVHRNRVIIPAKDWEAFEAWIDGPAADNPGLAGLAGRKPAWER